MAPSRRLKLTKETLTELRSDELQLVAGADASGATCTVRTTRLVSEMFISMCGCFTNYCSIDVC